MPSQSQRSPSSPSSHQSTHASGVEVTPSDAEELDDQPQGEHEPTLEEMRAAWRAQQRPKPSKSPQTPTKAPDPYEADDSVTVLLPSVYRAVMEGRESKGHRVFIGAEQPGPINEDTGRPERSVAVTLTFQGGVCRDVPYGVVKGLKKSRAYRSDDALKVIPNDTPETTYARLCGVQPMQPQKQAAMLLASDLDAVLAEFSTEQLKTFSAALARRVHNAQESRDESAAGTAGGGSGILNSQSFQRG